jgi:hypothetical protein
MWLSTVTTEDKALDGVSLGHGISGTKLIDSRTDDDLALRNCVND